MKQKEQIRTFNVVNRRPKSVQGKVFAAFLLCLSFTLQFESVVAQFTTGNIVVEQVGDGTTVLGSAAMKVQLLQFTTSGSSQPGTGYFGSTGTPTSAPFNLVETGTGTSNGYLSLSVDKTFIAVSGYNGASGTAGIASSNAATNGRTIGKALPNGSIAANGTFNTLSSNNYRSIVSTGTAFWLTGAAGIVYTPTDVTSGIATTATTIFSTNTRNGLIFNNTLFVSTSSGSFNGTGSNLGIYQVGSFNTLPTSLVTAGTATNIINSTSTGSPYAFAFSPNGLICYVADDRVIASGGGIQKWIYSGSFSTTTGWSGGSWSLTYTLNPSTGAVLTFGARGLTVDFSGANPVLYATTSETALNRVVKITDAGASSTATLLATATTNNIFRGICFAPTAPCSNTTTSTSVTSCNSYTWSNNNTTYTVSGTYTKTALIGAGPCTNTDTLNLTINNSSSSSESATACDTYTWSANGVTYTASGAYTATSLNAAGCAHTTTLNLTINNSSSSSESATACDTYTWSANSVTYTASGAYTATSLNASGCAHTTTLNLTINNSTSNTSSATACATYLWSVNGTTYTASGTYTATSLNAAGCTLTESLNLTITSPSGTTINQTACDSYTWASNGVTYTTSGTYTNPTSCGTDILNLTVNYSSSSASSATACDSYTWTANGVTYTASGAYTATSLNAAGCTHTTTLNLTINNNTTSSATATACDTYTWAANGVTYTASGTYTYTSLNAASCTNTATLNLTITPSSTNTTTIAANNSYTWSVTGQTYTTSGIKTGTTTNCVSELLDLTITPIEVNLSVSANAGSEAAGTTVTVTATATAPVNGIQTVSLGVSGTGITAGDYTLSNSTITIPNGQTTGSVTFTVVNDVLVEGTETATLTISSPSSGITLGTPTTQNITITDNDIATVLTFVRTDTTALESAGTAKVFMRVTTAGNVAGTVNLSVSSYSTATGSGTDYSVPITLNVPANTTVGQLLSFDFTINDDALAEADEYVICKTSGTVNVSVSGTTQSTLYIRDNDKLAPVASNQLGLNYVGSFSNGAAGTNSAEISAYDSASKRIFIANSVANKLDIVNFTNPAAPVLISSINLSVAPFNGAINSVDVFNGKVALALEGLTDKQANGKVVFTDINGTYISEAAAGAMPDMITFNHAGTKVYTANEGEPNAAYTNDPVGSITVVDISGGVASPSASTIGFTAYNGQETALRSQGIRIYGVTQPGSVPSTAAQDFEPEYITISDDDSKAWVTLQENNALVELDLSNNTIVKLIPLGFKDHSNVNNPLDVSDQTFGINLSNFNIRGMYEPDAITQYTSGGNIYLLTANEGDSRAYTGFSEEVRMSALNLDPTVYPNSADLKNNAVLGRMTVTNKLGDIDNDGDIDQIYCLGGRSFSIWNPALVTPLVYDSKDDMERITSTSAAYSQFFNMSNTIANTATKNRSDDKGPEPEGITTAKIGSRTYAFIGLERIGGAMVYDITNPASPAYVTYANSRTLAGGDRGAEGVMFIPASKSPNGKGLVVLSNEISSTLSVFEVAPCSAPGIAAIANIGSTSICPGSFVKLYNTDNNATYTRQWLKDGAVIPGATDSVYNATTSGSYRLVAFNSTGCVDTSAAITVTTQSSTSSATASACDTYTWDANGVTYTASGTYTATSLNAGGCTNTATLNLTVNQSSTSSTTASACDTYTWAANGVSYTTSGTYIYNSLNAAGCINTATLNLTINNSTTSSSSATACDTYTWSANSVTYTASGAYTATSLNAAGCTNTATLNLTINNSTTSSTTATACDTYTWTANGVTYTASGMYTATSLNAAGCTNTATLNLVINNSTSSLQTVSAYLTYTWAANGVTYTASGTYTVTSLNVAGCLHTATLNLTILTGISVSPKVILSGAYDVSTGLMYDSLRVNNLIPTIEPYSSAPFMKLQLSGPGGETVSSSTLAVTGNDAIVDWVFVELRSASNSAIIVATKRALLQRDGDVVNADGTSPLFFNGVAGGNYFVSIKHRNHLGVMSASSISLAFASTSIDFTSASMAVYTNPSIVNTPRKIQGSVATLWTGDANNNKNVRYNGLSNDKDAIYQALANNVNSVLSGYRTEDVNLDGKVKYNNSNNDRNVIGIQVGVVNPNAIISQHTPN